MTEENNAGAKCSITQKKIDNLYKMILTFKTPSLIAKRLGVDTRTYLSWISKGNDILNEHKDFYAELTDCVLDVYTQVQEYIDSHKPQIQTQFIKETCLEAIGAKSINRYHEYETKIGQKLLEEKTNSIENEMIDNYTFFEHDGKNEQAKKYVKVARIANRAELAFKGEYLSYIDKQAPTAKNVGLALKMLEITDDDFKQKPSVNIENNGGTISFVDFLKDSNKDTAENKE